MFTSAERPSGFRPTPLKQDEVKAPSAKPGGFSFRLKAGMINLSANSYPDPLSLRKGEGRGEGCS